MRNLISIVAILLTSGALAQTTKPAAAKDAPGADDLRIGEVREDFNDRPAIGRGLRFELRARPAGDRRLQPRRRGGDDCPRIVCSDVRKDSIDVLFYGFDHVTTPG